MTEVVAALIWDGNRFLICQRPGPQSPGLTVGICWRQGGTGRNKGRSFDPRVPGGIGCHRLCSGDFYGGNTSLS